MRRLVEALRTVFTRRSRQAVDGLEPELRERAQRSAKGIFTGPADQEPTVRMLLDRVRADVSHRFRTNTQLRDAQAAEAAAAQEVDRAEEDEGAVITVTAAALPGPQDWNGTPEARTARTAAREAQHRRATAAQETARARRAHQDKALALQTLEARVMDDLAVVAEHGLRTANEYVAEFNSHRIDIGMPGLDLLGNDIVRGIVRDAVRPIMTDPKT